MSAPAPDRAADPPTAPRPRFLGRLGLFGRLVGIVLLLLVALAALGLGIAFAVRDGNEAVRGVPLPGQIAAIAALLETAGPELRPAALAAVQTRQLRVTLRPDWPAPLAAGGAMPGLEWLIVRHMAERRPVRAVSAETGPPRGLTTLPRPRLRRWLRDVDIGVALASGEIAHFEVRATTPNRLFGVPVGFWIGSFGFLFAAIAVWAIAREARPLARLAASVEAFGRDGRPRPVEGRGAAEIRRLVAAVNAMQARIAALIRARSVLLGAVSHDLKTFITRLRLRVEALEPEAARERAEADLDAMTRLIEDALAVARGADHASARAPVDLAALLAEEVAARPGAPVALARPEGPALVAGDAVGLRRLFANLIENALRYGHRAEVALARGPGAVTVVVDDDGPGIPEAERDAVFEPFYRLEGSRSRETGGSGLGLAIVRQIAEGHGGTVELTDAPSGGARFRVRLPAA